MDVIEKLFKGKINPIDWTPESEEYHRWLKKSGDIGRALSAGLSQEQNKMFDEYMDVHLDMEIIIHEELFRRAFLLGVQMQREIKLLSDKNED